MCVLGLQLSALEMHSVVQLCCYFVFSSFVHSFYTYLQNNVELLKKWTEILDKQLALEVRAAEQETPPRTVSSDGETLRTPRQRIKRSWSGDNAESPSAKKRRLDGVTFDFNANLNNKVLEGRYYGAKQATEGAAGYIRGVMNVGSKEEREYAWDNISNKNRSHYFCAYGQMGKGKTRFHNELCQGDVKVSDLLDVQFVRITYNEKTDLKRIPGADALTFGRNLLMFHGCSWESALGIHNLQEAVDIVSSHVFTGSEETKRKVLVICVDELHQLRLHEAEDRDDVIGSLLRDLCTYQDSTLKQEVAVLFLFSSVTMAMMDAVAAPSQRSAAEYFVPEIPPKDALELLWERRPDLKKRYDEETVLQQLVHLCVPTPRALLEGIPKAYEEHHKTIEMGAAVKTVAEAAQMRLKSLENVLPEGTVHTWLTDGNLPENTKTELFKFGLTIGDEMAPQDRALHPLALRCWCEIVKTKVGTYIREAYIADSSVQLYHEKDVESLLYSFEAAKRIAYGSTNFLLKNYYAGGHLHDVSSVSVSVRVDPEHPVRHVESFREHDKVKDALDFGSIVVSDQPNEPAIEYLTPFFVDNKLKYVAAAQVKFSPNKWISGGYEAIAKAAMEHPIIMYLQGNNITCFPVIFSSSHGNLPRIAAKVTGVLFNEAGLCQLTSRLGPLRLHREKASTEMKQDILQKAGLQPGEEPDHLHDWDDGERSGVPWQCPICKVHSTSDDFKYSCREQRCRTECCRKCRFSSLN